MVGLQTHRYKSEVNRNNITLVKSQILNSRLPLFSKLRDL